VERIDDGWQDVGFVLAQFAATKAEAQRAYREFVAARLSDPPLELPECGVMPRPGYWEVVPCLRRGREAWANGERLLGSERVPAIPAADVGA